jgi:hypothetical protein
MGFFNLHKPLQYKYRYIYYDPKKEAQKEREQRNSDQKKDVNEGFKPFIQRGTFREMANHQQSRRSSVMQSNVRLVVIILILVLIMYFLVS